MDAGFRELAKTVDASAGRWPWQGSVCKCSCVLACRRPCELPHIAALLSSVSPCSVCLAGCAASRSTGRGSKRLGGPGGSLRCILKRAAVCAKSSCIEAADFVVSELYEKASRFRAPKGPGFFWLPGTWKSGSEAFDRLGQGPLCSFFSVVLSRECGNGSL